MRDVAQLQRMADRIRLDVLEMTFKSGVNGGHMGGSFSSAEILAVLYGDILNVPKDTLDYKYRDRFILSKGHVAIAHYAALKEAGLLSDDELLQFEVSGSDFPTHETINVAKGIEFSSGSLGYGASLGVGTALMAKRKKLTYKTYVLLGDGECNEGSVWEALMAAAKFRLNNLTFIIDANGQQLDGKDVMPIADFQSVCGGFGCYPLSINGNDINQLIDAFDKDSCEKPKVIIAHTLKMSGLPSVEGKEGFHHVRLDEELYQRYKMELEGRYGL